MKRNSTKYAAAAIFVLGLTLSASAWAQWSSDANQNLALSDIAGADQVQPKLAPLPDSSWYVSWFNANPNDPPPNGYDTYLQRLDPNGIEQFQHDGVQVAKLTNSSTEDYGLDTDAQGNALLAFLDTRENPNQQITAAKMAPNGQPLWGPLGVQLTHGGSNLHSPKIAATSDGGVVVAWTSGSNLVLEKLNANGRPVWPGASVRNPGLVLGETGYNYMLSDLHASDNGSVIVSFSRDHGFRTNRFLYANKISATGALLWGTGHVKVWDGGSLQLGNYPSFIPDGSGGAVFAWYSSNPSLQVFVQHVLANGTEAFAHNGVAVSTNGANVRVDPAASYRPSTQEIFVFWEEEDALQSVSGVYGQKLNATGARQWGDTGLQIVPLGNNAEIFEKTVQIGDGAFAFWVDQQVTQNGTIQGIRLDNAGNTVCAQFPVSSVDSPKSRPWAAIAPSGLTAVAFQDSRSGNSDIYIQNINPDCSLGIESRHPGKGLRR
ncbi:MAG: hypothetical protein ABI383_07580 [Acidobacteriaceae bacterium]